MLKLHHVVAITLLATPGAAFAETPASDAAAKAAEEDKLVCRRIAETGSLARTTKVCRTRKDWKAIQQASRKEATEMSQSVNAASSN